MGARETGARPLAGRIDGAEVALDVVSQDRYERLVAVVYVGDENINAWMVQQGHAWAYRQYLDDKDYCAWEGSARSTRRADCGHCRETNATRLGNGGLQSGGRLPATPTTRTRQPPTASLRWGKRPQPPGRQRRCRRGRQLQQVQATASSRATSAAAVTSTTSRVAPLTAPRRSTHPKASGGSARKRRRELRDGGRQEDDIHREPGNELHMSCMRVPSHGIEFHRSGSN